MRVQVQRCTEEQLPEAASLTAEIHARTRKNEPLLPASYEDPAVSVRMLADKEDVWVATRGGQVVAVLAATVGKFGAYSQPLEVAGEPDALMDVYTAAADDWVSRDVLTHSVHIPLGAPELIEPFLHLGFGYQAQYGMHSLNAIPEGPELTVTRASIDDFEDLLPLTRALPDHLAKSPVFLLRTDSYYESLRKVHRGNFDTDIVHYFVARSAGRAVGLMTSDPAEESPLEPPGGRYLNFAVVLPEHRGTGVGLALTRAVLAEAVECGATAVGSDWRTTNWASARFWRSVGFRPTCLRLFRRIDVAQY
jgi:ribosomal protein S18 acetylase RimI-like enzyme